MIAELFEPFQEVELIRKIAYQIEKIEKGVARELFNSTGDSIIDMRNNMLLVASLNDRVKLPFIEFVLSSPVGEELTDSQFIDVANEYMQEMGYSDSCYFVVKHDDKDNKHIHILATKVDFNGIRINDSMSKIHSGKVMRNLEKKYNLEVMEKGKTSHNKTLGESQYRQYFFDTALHKALRSHNANERVNNMLLQSDTYLMLNPDLSKPYTNTEWKVMLGDDVYEKMLEVLSDSKFFNPLYKDELLAAMDRLYLTSNNVAEFREKLKKESYYMRLVTEKGNSHYIYGIPERGFYIKDKALPERYRFGKLAFEGQQMASDEQKHYLYNKIFAVLNNSLNYDDFKQLLFEHNVTMIEHINKTGIYGLSFVMMNVSIPQKFKGSDISRRLTYDNILNYFRREEQLEVITREGTNTSQRTRIEPILICYLNNKQEWDSELSYMYPTSPFFSSIPIDIDTGKKKNSDDEHLRKKKKRKRNKGLSI